MESTTMTTSRIAPRPVADGGRLVATWSTRVRHCAAAAVEAYAAAPKFAAAPVQKPAVAPMLRNITGTALLPISDVVVFDGLAGTRSSSPPV